MKYPLEEKIAIGPIFVEDFLEKVKAYATLFPDKIILPAFQSMGGGICKAVAKIFPNAPDFVCRFHFSRDIGKDYLVSIQEWH